MKVCPECNHENTDYADYCEKCLSKFESSKKVIVENEIYGKIGKDNSTFITIEIIGILCILYEAFLAISGLIRTGYLDFQFIVVSFLAIGILILGSMIKELRNQIIYLQKYIDIKDHEDVEKTHKV